MPKIRTSRTKAPPDGFDEIEPTLLEFNQRLKDSMLPISLAIIKSGVLTCSQNNTKRHQKEERVALASIPNQPSTQSIHLRLVLYPRSYQHRAVPMATEAELRGCKSYCKMEETGL